jgi:hypothetical protein
VTIAYPVGDLLEFDDPFAQATAYDDRLVELQHLIYGSCGDQSDWREIGGGPNAITPAGGKLFIRTTPGIHWQIEQLLAALRAK